MALQVEVLPATHHWQRIADPAWADPIDATHAGRLGGRWNPPATFPVLYLNEDVVTARFNLRLFTAGWPYEPEDLQEGGAPVLVDVGLPAEQSAADIHTPGGVHAAGLPLTFPYDGNGDVISHDVCQPTGVRAHGEALAGVRARSAQTPHGEGRELAWFPHAGTHAEILATSPWSEWYWG